MVHIRKPTGKVMIEPSTLQIRQHLIIHCSPINILYTFIWDIEANHTSLDTKRKIHRTINP